jgi:hypothetical protein
MAGYIGATPVPQATQHREAFTATANQVSFATAGYTPQFIDIYLNGVKLAPSDYVATNGSDVVLATGAAASDILEYVAYTPFEVANQTFTGTTTLTDSGAAPLVVNRTTSDGAITTYQKDGTTVGAMGTDTTFGDFYVQSQITNHAGLGFKVNEVLPRRNGYVDGIDNLGSSTYRFNNLYLSGGVYLGGTGAANYLDDYEEGTWTPNLARFSGGGITATYSTRVGYYTKVGNIVTLTCYVIISSISAQGSSISYISDLPFQPTRSNDAVGVVSANSGFATVEIRTCIANDSSRIYFRTIGNGAGLASPNFSAGGEISLTLQYMTS